MIPLSRLDVQNKSWQQELAQAITDPVELCHLLELPSELTTAAQSAAQHFSLKVTRDYLACMEKGNIHDPLLRQVLPLAADLQTQPGFVPDPVGDHG